MRICFENFLKLVVQPESYGIERVLDLKAKKEFTNK